MNQPPPGVPIPLSPPATLTSAHSAPLSSSPSPSATPSVPTPENLSPSAKDTPIPIKIVHGDESGFDEIERVGNLIDKSSKYPLTTSRNMVF